MTLNHLLNSLPTLSVVLSKLLQSSLPLFPLLKVIRCLLSRDNPTVQFGFQKYSHSLFHSLCKACLRTEVVGYDTKGQMNLSIQLCIGWYESKNSLFERFVSQILFGLNHPPLWSKEFKLLISWVLFLSKHPLLSLLCLYRCKPSLNLPPFFSFFSWKYPQLNFNTTYKDPICLSYNAKKWCNMYFIWICNLCNQVGCN